MALLPVEEAKARVLAGVRPLGVERVSLAQALGRVLARDIAAARDQPPFAASAMDGYAVRATDVAEVPARLRVVGVAPAGHAFRGNVGAGEAVRIFTGGPMPKGADTVVIQENTEPDGAHVIVKIAPRPGYSVRAKALDFAKGEKLLIAGARLNARSIGLAASMNHSFLPVRRKPRVSILTTGDELVLPGERPRADQIISSNSPALCSFVATLGGEATDLGIVPDDLSKTVRAIRKAREADILVTTGGASVGDHDFVGEALLRAGVTIDFWKIAMRPGKPFMFGRKSGLRVIGLPGNPVSALVCARLFLNPLLDALLGRPAEGPLPLARLGSPMPANDSRQDYVRAKLSGGEDGALIATPFAKQDSSMLRTFADAHCLIVRPPDAPSAGVKSLVPVLLIDF